MSTTAQHIRRILVEFLSANRKEKNKQKYYPVDKVCSHKNREHRWCLLRQRRCPFNENPEWKPKKIVETYCPDRSVACHGDCDFYKLLLLNLYQLFGQISPPPPRILRTEWWAAVTDEGGDATTETMRPTASHWSLIRCMSILMTLTKCLFDWDSLIHVCRILHSGQYIYAGNICEFHLHFAICHTDSTSS